MKPNHKQVQTWVNQGLCVGCGGTRAPGEALCFRDLAALNAEPKLTVSESTLTNEEKIRAIRRWQAAGYVHELTCRMDSSHEALVPLQVDEHVALYCLTCGDRQTEIPESVYHLHPNPFANQEPH